MSRGTSRCRETRRWTLSDWSMLQDGSRRVSYSAAGRRFPNLCQRRSRHNWSTFPVANAVAKNGKQACVPLLAEIQAKTSGAVTAPRADRSHDASRQRSRARNECSDGLIAARSGRNRGQLGRGSVSDRGAKREIADRWASDSQRAHKSPGFTLAGARAIERGLQGLTCDRRYQPPKCGILILVKRPSEEMVGCGQKQKRNAPSELG